MSKNFVRAMEIAHRDSATLNPLAFLPIDLDFAGNVRPTLTEACFLIRIINESNVEVFISYDGVHAQDYLGVGDMFTIDFQTNASPTNSTALLAKNSVIYLNGNVGVGEIIVVGYYQER